MSERPLLLDTHAWIWLFEGRPDRLADDLVVRLERAGRSSALFVSAISVWELGMLVAKGRLVLNRDVADWVSATRRAPGVRVVTVGAAIALAAAALPPGLHGDPADRLIAATARHRGATLVTADERLIAYGASGHLDVVAARA